MGIWQKKLNEIIDGSSPLPNVNSRLGLGRLTSWRTGFVEKEWEVDPSFCTAEGTSEQALFGGYIGALADQVLAFTAMTVLDDRHFSRTVELKLSFFHKIKAGRLRITGIVTSQSGQILHADAHFYVEEDKLAARATCIQMFVPFRSDTPRPS